MQKKEWFQPGTPFSDAPAAPGDFYVEEQECMACGAPAMEAPGLMAHRRGSSCCFFVRQPNNPKEFDQAMRAVNASCCGAVQYRGSDPEVLKQVPVTNSLGYVRPLVSDSGSSVRPILSTPPVGPITRFFERFK